MKAWPFALSGVGFLLLALLGHAPADSLLVLKALIAGEDLAPMAGVVLLFHHGPRLAAGVLVGACLGMAGTALQAVMRNPLAAPDLLGATAGAHLALALALLLFPALPIPIFGIAILGAGGAVLLTIAVAGGLTAPPLRLLLAGVAVSLAAGAAAIAAMLAGEERTAGLALWITGSLVQVGWDAGLTLAPWIGAALLGLLLLAGPLNLLGLGRDTAQGLGLRVRRIEAAAALLATVLAAGAVCLAGPIGLIGTLVPNGLRLAGVRGHYALLPLSALWGAGLLVAADGVAGALSTGSLPVPAGVAVTLLGAPLLYLLVRRQPRLDRPARSETSAALGRFRSEGLLLLALLLAGGVVWHAATSRLPRALYLDLAAARTVTALAAGALLGISGALLQGVIRNPLAGPELLGVGPGASVAALALLLLWPDAGLIGMQVAAFAGGFLALLLVLAGGVKTGLSPARLALLGLIVGMLAGAVARLLILDARLQLGQALTWLAGSTYGRSWQEAAALGGWLLVLLPLAVLLAARIDLLALGRETAQGLGLAVGRARAGLLILAVAASAASVACVGAIGFIGLIAPHAARLLGARRGRAQVITAALLGALLLAIADLAGRSLLAPREIPAGLMAALAGAPYFLWLLRRSGASA
ncbi:iron chelate uptake ABC transporter family permease subunit [Elstera cyanobacteriorum]|uniref:iron chelate uptake ABC transporter family permease subunit n=1 Tax=Elstera cyanobacteriorum TaxID=2022747 RepID=UPI002355958E|nr:iron chelate uptake ABC transporter family permease subunit [Elstera cyanobacteriorum]MCK6443313.1 iron chelate uptake ABC transporter family permease subunit [Elstera cyanobacteriorum]